MASRNIQTLLASIGLSGSNGATGSAGLAEYCGPEYCGLAEYGEPRGGNTTPGTLTKPNTEAETRSSAERQWNVIVWNDPINLMSYVTFVLQKLFGYSCERATKHMLEIHQQGRSIVATVDREKGEYYVSRLHQFGLQATLEQGTAG